MPCAKEIEKGKTLSNFRPITCLPLVWKLLTAVLAEKMYMLSRELMGCRKGNRDTKDQLLINQMTVKNCKRRLT